MDTTLETIRELLIEAIDRLDDTGRLADTGPWPSLLNRKLYSWPSRDIWVPEAVIAVSRDELHNFVSRLRRASRNTRQFPSGPRISDEGCDQLLLEETGYLVPYRLLDDPEGVLGTLQFWIGLNSGSVVSTLDDISLNPLYARFGKMLSGIRPKDAALEKVRSAQMDLARQKSEYQTAVQRAHENLDRWRLKRMKPLWAAARQGRLDCPHCGRRSRDFRTMKLFFICRRCGCSSWPEDLPGEQPPPEAVAPRDSESFGLMEPGHLPRSPRILARR